jgi:hypothetical protein
VTILFVFSAVYLLNGNPIVFGYFVLAAEGKMVPWEHDGLLVGRVSQAEGVAKFVKGHVKQACFWRESK